MKTSRFFIGKEDHEVICFAIYHPIRGTQLVFGDYMAVRSSHRRRGISRLFHRQVVPLLGSEELIVIGEQDHPDFGDNREEKRRRIEHFRKLGFRHIWEVPYLLPDLCGDEEPTRSVLWVFARRPVVRLEGEKLRSVIITVFSELYHKPRTDPVLVHNLKNIPEEVLVS